MNPLPKVLGLVIVALAMSGLASSAQALEFTTETGEYPAEIHGESSAGDDVFKTEAGSVECDSTFSGSLEEKSSTIAVHAEYSECKAFGFVSATIETEECDYVLHLESEVEDHTYTATTSVVCPEGQSIKITAATCEAEVGSQEGLGHELIEVDTPPPNRTETTTKTVGEIKYTVTKDGFLCPFNGTGEKEDGEEVTEGNPATSTSTPAIHAG